MTMSTDAQREAVARFLFRREFPNGDARHWTLLACRFFDQADEVIAAYEAAAPEDLRPTLICRTCGLAAIVEPTKDPAP